eukprot:1367806-Amphidinium_carterae.1
MACIWKAGLVSVSNSLSILGDFVFNIVFASKFLWLASCPEEWMNPDHVPHFAFLCFILLVFGGRYLVFAIHAVRSYALQSMNNDAVHRTP